MIETYAPILVIQTAFIGDVILATSLIEPLKKIYPLHPLHFLVREGNEELLKHDPQVEKVWIWKKKRAKYWELFKLQRQMKSLSFHRIFNLHRHASSSLLACSLESKALFGFKENPLSLINSDSIAHSRSGDKRHEIDKLLELVPGYLAKGDERPQIFASKKDLDIVTELGLPEKYICLAPGSVWRTKQLPTKKWKEILEAMDTKDFVVLIGGKDAEETALELSHGRPKVLNFCGRLSLLQSYLIIKNAKLFIGNDSAPLHLASAANTPSQAVFLSTVPEFGYGPRADRRAIAQVSHLGCRPCGTHGRKACPLGHFQCAQLLEFSDFELLETPLSEPESQVDLS